MEVKRRRILVSHKCTANMFEPFLSSRGSSLFSVAANDAMNKVRRKLLDQKTSAGGAGTPSLRCQELLDRGQVEELLVRGHLDTFRSSPVPA